MIETGWDKKPGVTIVFGRWQDKLAELGTYDGIFFDTYGIQRFFEHLFQGTRRKHLPASLLRPSQRRHVAFSRRGALRGYAGFPQRVTEVGLCVTPIPSTAPLSSCRHRIAARLGSSAPAVSTPFSTDW